MFAPTMKSITVSSFRPNGINGSFVGVTSCTKLVSRLLCANTSHALYCAITRIQVWNSFLYTKRHKTASARPRATFVSRPFHAITPDVSNVTKHFLHARRSQSSSYCSRPDSNSISLAESVGDMYPALNNVWKNTAQPAISVRF